MDSNVCLSSGLAGEELSYPSSKLWKWAKGGASTKEVYQLHPGLIDTELVPTSHDLLLY
jgi:hypothetical protein